MTSVSRELVDKLENARTISMLSNQPDLVSPWLDEEMTYIHSSAVRDTKRTYLESLRERRLVYRDIRTRYDDVVSLSAEVFLLTGRFNADIEWNGKPVELDNLFIAVWIHRTNDRWRLISWQSTPIPAAGSSESA